MSFDYKAEMKIIDWIFVLIPFVQGSVFRHRQPVSSNQYRQVLIPFVQGSVFRLSEASVEEGEEVLIPFVQGSVFRLYKKNRK